MLNSEPDLGLARHALRMAQPDRRPYLPFGAVVAGQGRLAVAATNEVRSSGDPTAHAEIVAIRALALKKTNPSDCVLYASCEPCIMCAAAIVRSGFAAVWYCASREVALKYGFADVAAPSFARTVLPEARLVGGLSASETERPFEVWQSSERA